MSTTTPELILVVPASVAGGVIHLATTKNPTSYADGFFQAEIEDLGNLVAHGTFTGRVEAEDNPEFKQLIVYTAVFFQGNILSYTRGKVGQEPRLHAKQSIGVGGHINPEDWDISLPDAEIFHGAVRRELKEEVGITDSHINRMQFIGFVNEDTTDVGKVHFGLVFFVDLNHIEGLAFEEAFLNPRWLEEDELDSNHELEVWSGAVRDALLKAGREEQEQLSASGMLPHQIRVAQECAALDDNITKLDAFIGGEKYDQLDSAEQDRLNRQRLHMRHYSEVLHERICAW